MSCLECSPFWCFYPNQTIEVDFQITNLFLCKWLARAGELPSDQKPGSFLLGSLLVRLTKWAIDRAVDSVWSSVPSPVDSTAKSFDLWNLHLTFRNGTAQAQESVGQGCRGEHHQAAGWVGEERGAKNHGAEKLYSPELYTFTCAITGRLPILVFTQRTVSQIALCITIITHVTRLTSFST